MSILSAKARRFLEEVRFGVLATIEPSGLPQQTVVWYELEGDEILMNTVRGRVKERNLRRDPRLSLCVPDGYTYVTITGTATLVDDQAIAQADIARLAIRSHGQAGAAAAIAEFRKQARVTIRVPIEHVVTNGL